MRFVTALDGLARLLPNARERREAADPRRVARRRPPPPWLKPALRAGYAAGGVAVIAGGVAWLVQSGWLGDRWDDARAATLAASAGLGMTVQEVLVLGRQKTDVEALLAASGVNRGDPLLGLDPKTARTRLEALPWVKSALVERSFPDAVRINLIERQPLALWQENGALRLIDTEGQAIAVEDIRRFRDLPIVVGEDAPEHAAALLDMVAREPLRRSRVTAAVRVAARRWNVRVDDRVDVRLPAEGAEAAWTRLTQVEREYGVLQRDIVAVDLRLPDRLIVQLAPGAMERIQAERKASATSDSGELARLD